MVRERGSSSLRTSHVVAPGPPQSPDCYQAGRVVLSGFRRSIVTIATQLGPAISISVSNQTAIVIQALVRSVLIN
jgi:hypothetical protein